MGYSGRKSARDTTSGLDYTDGTKLWDLDFDDMTMTWNW